MFQALLAHTHEVRHKRHLVYGIRVMSPTTPASKIPYAVCAGPPEHEQVMLEPCRGPNS
jgi:hypothetical protein